MKAFIEHEIPQGLGKKSIIVLSLGNNFSSLIISIPYDRAATWVKEEPGCLSPEDGLKEIDLPDDLAKRILMFHENRHNELNQGITKRLKELANELRRI